MAIRGQRSMTKEHVANRRFTIHHHAIVFIPEHDFATNMHLLFFTNFCSCELFASFI